MPLTKSLYNQDEVLAALKWCLLRGRLQQTVFWSQECLDSNLISEFLQALVWVWLFGCGSASLGWISRLRLCLQKGQACTQSEYIDLVISLGFHAKSRGDSSTLALLGMGLMNQSEEPNTITLMNFPQGLEDTPLARALLQGKSDLAWSLLRPLWKTGAWEILTQVLTYKHPHCADLFSLLKTSENWMQSAWIPEWEWCIRAFACATVCSHAIVILSEEAPPSLDLSSERLNYMDLPMRRRRLYQIPLDCLYWMTRRGSLRVNQSNETELTGMLEDGFVGSRFWHTKMPVDDESRETFYQTYFPNDIPDEWSRESRLMSHGQGVLPVGDSIDHSIIISRCLARWFASIPCKTSWRGLEKGLAEFQRRWSVKLPPTLQWGIHEAYSNEALPDEWVLQMASWSLEAKKREFVVY
jgi:hypothetical protein